MFKPLKNRFRYPNPKTNHRFDQNDWEDFFVNDYDYEDEERRKKNAKKRKNRQNGHNGHSSAQVRGHSFFGMLRMLLRTFS